MTPELRAILDEIETFLLGPHGHELAAVMSALRGPDGDAHQAEIDKQRSTIHIRRAAFPKIAENADKFNYDGIQGKWDMRYHRGARFLQYNTDPDLYHRSGGAHFNNHVNDAALALGILPEGFVVY